MGGGKGRGEGRMSVERELFASVVVVKDSIFFDFLLVSDFLGRDFYKSVVSYLYSSPIAFF